MEKTDAGLNKTLEGVPVKAQKIYRNLLAAGRQAHIGKSRVTGWYVVAQGLDGQVCHYSEAGLS